MPEANPTQDRAVIIGESLVDLIKYEGTDHVPVGHPGGSPYNVALTLGRLGQSVNLVTALADDDHGLQVLHHLHESGVRLGAGSYALDRTSTALAQIDSSGSASYIFDFSWVLPAEVPIPPTAAFVHAGSISTATEPGAGIVLETLRRARNQALITYDPNVRPTLTPDRDQVRARVEEFAACADLIKVSDEDLAWLYPESSLDEVARAWFELSTAQLVVVTCGGDGPTAWLRSGGKVSSPPQPVTVVDTVGAGDSFMGGLIDALWRRGLTFRAGADRLGHLDEAAVKDLLDEAGAVAAITVSRAGANPPWLAELKR